MKKNLFIYLICINMICFAIWNLPLYKYLCGLSVAVFYNPTMVNVATSSYIHNPLLGLSTSTHCNLLSVVVQTYIIQPNYQQHTEFINFTTCEIYELYLHTTLVKANNVDFFALQDKIYILQLETNLIFFRMFNANQFSVFGITIYMISPIEYWFCINKIQCFCFEKILIHAHECIDLPVLFFFNNIINTTNTTHSGAIIVNYIFFPYTYSSMVEQLNT